MAKSLRQSFLSSVLQSFNKEERDPEPDDLILELSHGEKAVDGSEWMLVF